MPIQVDEYESLRGSRKDQKAMTVPRTVREAILKVDCGYSRMHRVLENVGAQQFFS
jgi:hypothetical protein